MAKEPFNIPDVPGDRWQPFGNQPSTCKNTANGQWIKWSLRRPRDPGDRSAMWLRSAMIALGLLAAAAAAVSFEAQYRMVYAAKDVRWAAGLEAAIPDAAALVFASLGIALALHGKRAIRARLLNVGAVATSVCMNLLAASSGWRNLAIWVMPSIAYALASDTAIGVIRAWALARKRELGEALADDESTPLATVGRVALYGLRFLLAAPSTARGLRQQVLNMTPLPEVEAPAAPVAALPAVTELVGLEPEPDVDEPRPERERPGRRRQAGESKTAKFLELVEDRHGPLAAIDPAHVSRIATSLAPEVGLNAGSARSALRPLVLAAQNGHSS